MTELCTGVPAISLVRTPAYGRRSSHSEVTICETALVYVQIKLDQYTRSSYAILSGGMSVTISRRVHPSLVSGDAKLTFYVSSPNKPGKPGSGQKTASAEAVFIQPNQLVTKTDEQSPKDSTGKKQFYPWSLGGGRTFNGGKVNDEYAHGPVGSGCMSFHPQASTKVLRGDARRLQAVWRRSSPTAAVAGEAHCSGVRCLPALHLVSE